MRVLYLHRNEPDYLAESLFHGLRSLLGDQCVDVPRYDSMYAPLSDAVRAKLRGHGFTLYGLLDEIPALAERRFHWRGDLEEYQLIVVANVWEQWELIRELLERVPASRIAVLDGSDSPAIFPFGSHRHRIRRVPWSYFVPVYRARYFKREWVTGAPAYGLDRVPGGTSLGRHLPTPASIRSIAFSIPEENLASGTTEERVQLFPRHLVDPEVAAAVPASAYGATGSNSYAFRSADEYYSDLRRSRFGITTKRAGWDCLRHYELAAAGCVLCFRDLDRKPATSAPHGLDDSNCITYRSYEQLADRIERMGDVEYAALQRGSFEWATRNTTLMRAREFLNKCGYEG